MPRRSTNEPKRRGKQAPPRTPEEQENLMISLSMQQAEELLRTGKAPTGVVMHFLKLATEKERAQTRKLNADAEMAIAKSEYVKTQQRHEQDYQEVLNAMRGYGINSGVMNDTELHEDYNDYDLGIKEDFADGWFRPPH